MVDPKKKPDPVTEPKKTPPVFTPVAVVLADASKTLYTGANPVQTGVKEGTITARRSAMLRGKVSDRAGKPIAGVKITIAHHPAFGSAKTGTDGGFDMAVNGGRQLCVDYRKDGFLPLN